jgi:hypothetical protein
MILIALIGFPLALAAAVIVFSLWLPLFPVWAIMWPCRDADRSFIDFLKSNANVMMYVYAGPVAVSAVVVSVVVNAVLCVPVWLFALVRYTYSRCKREQEENDAFNEEKLWRMLRFYFMSLCIVVYFAPLLCIAAAAATCVLVIQIIAIPRTFLMYRDTESLEFLIDDCRSLFELFVHIIGSIPAAVIALATFPLGAGILLLNHVEVSETTIAAETNMQLQSFAIQSIVIISAG